MSKTKKILISLLWLFMVSGCSQLNYDVTPQDPGDFDSLKIKASFRSIDRKESIRIIFKSGHQDKARLTFLSPVNQLVGALVIVKEQAFLLNLKAGTYWQGRFEQLLKKMWRLEFSFAQLKQLIVRGKVPDKKPEGVSIKVDSKKWQETQYLPKLITVTGTDFSLKLKIYGRKKGQGRVNYKMDLSKYRAAGLEQVLRRD